MPRNRHPLALILAAAAVFTLWTPTLATPAAAASSPVIVATLA